MALQIPKIILIKALQVISEDSFRLSGAGKLLYDVCADAASQEL